MPREATVRKVVALKARASVDAVLPHEATARGTTILKTAASAGRCRLIAEFDPIVQLIYGASAGLESWIEPLRRIADATGAWAATLGGVDKRTGNIVFSYTAGPRPPEAAVEYIRTFHRLDPRIDLLRQGSVGSWVACADQCDEGYVARDPFYRDYALPFGSRYLYAAKLIEDDDMMITMGHHRAHGDPLVDPTETQALERLGMHVAEGFRLRRSLGRIAERDELGFLLLDRLHQPVILLDRDRNVTFASDAAQSMLDRGDPLFARSGVLVCRNAESDVALTIALHELASATPDSRRVGQSPEERRILRLRCAEGNRAVAATLFALRPRGTLVRSERQAPRALLMIHQPGAVREVDPGFLAAVFSFTPSEARTAARLAAGLSVEEIAAESKVSVSTVRTHLGAVFDKTGTHRQAELVRLLLATGAI